MSERGDSTQKWATVDGDKTPLVTSVLDVPWCTTGHTWQLGGPACLSPQGRIFLLGKDGVGDAQQQHPGDPARAWVSPCARPSARTPCCLRVCVQGGQAGHSLQQAGIPRGLQYHRGEDGHSRWATVSPEIPVPAVGERDGTSGSLAGGSLHCEHPDVCADTNSLEVTLVQLRCL